MQQLPIHGVHHDRVEKFIIQELKDLQLDYVDLYLVHNPAGIKADGWNILFENGKAVPDLTTSLEQVWKAMEAQVTAGRTKAIGISNYSMSQVDRIVKCAKILPANLQVNFYFDSRLGELLIYNLLAKPVLDWIECELSKETHSRALC